MTTPLADAVNRAVVESEHERLIIAAVSMAHVLRELGALRGQMYRDNLVHDVAEVVIAGITSGRSLGEVTKQAIELVAKGRN